MDLARNTFASCSTEKDNEQTAMHKMLRRIFCSAPSIVPVVVAAAAVIAATMIPIMLSIIVNKVVVISTYGSI